MGVDYDKFTTTSQSAAVAAATLKHKLKYAGAGSLPRLTDCTPKGLEERLEAYWEFPARTLSCTARGFICALLPRPPATDIAVYKKLGQRLQKLADDINLAMAHLPGCQ